MFVASATPGPEHLVIHSIPLWPLYTYRENAQDSILILQVFIMATHARASDAHVQQSPDRLDGTCSRTRLLQALGGSGFRFTHRPHSYFFCSYVESYKVIPKRNYYGAYG